MKPTPEQLKDPKWWDENAPEPATHYDVNDPWSPWMRVNASGHWQSFDQGVNEWIRMRKKELIDRGSDPESYIPRPNHSADITDMVNNPPHYQSANGIECIEAIRAALTPEEFRGYCKGNMIKYIWRERLKGGDESVEKAQWYGNQITDAPTR